MSDFIGIDLGTTFSAAAHIDEHGRATIVPNNEGERITPSVIYFGDDPPLVGKAAKEMQAAGAAEVASFFKRSMGDPSFALSFGSRSYTATDLSALVLAKIKADCEATLGRPVMRAVITVPAYFDNTHREATIEAGRRAGLEVLRIINEPTAAALAYGVHQTGRTETMLVYDLGGGTFDVTLVRITADEVQVLGTDGDHELGGKDWDDQVARFVAARFKEEHGIDPLEDSLNLNDLLVRAEKAKKELSQRTSTTVKISHGGVEASYALRREQFEEQTAGLLERTQRLTEQVLTEARVGWKDLTGVLLVGGSTRMPMVHRYVERMSGMPPRTGVNVDEAVALGAAIQAAIDVQAKEPQTRRFKIGGERRIIDVTSHSLGVIAESEDRSRFTNSVIIGRNTPVPSSGEKEYTILPNRGEAECIVYVTEGDGTDPRTVAVRSRYVCRGKVVSSDKSTRVVIRYAYDRNNTIQVSARLLESNVPLEVVQEPVGDLGWLSKSPHELNTFDPSSLDLVVTPPGFDDIGSILSTLRLPHRAWDGTCRANILFLNCGSEALPDPSELRSFVEQGGCVYASDLTHSLIELAFPSLFRFVGMTGTIGKRMAEIVDPELRTRLGRSLTVHFDMPGWAEVSSVSSDCSVLLSDKKTGRPLMAVGNLGSGKVFYTSFHNRSQASETERWLLQLLVAKQISVVSGVPIEVVTRATGIAIRRDRAV